MVLQGEEMKRIVSLLSLVLASAAMATESPKNIIMVIGDGMGPAYTTAYRYFSDNKETAQIDETVFDRHLVGMASTYPARQSGYVTDSAAGATALSSGNKSYNGAIGVDINKQPVESILQFAKKHGKKTGIAVTSQINHATPAAFSAHNEYRRNYNEIANSYFDDKVDGKFVLDVMLGGGWEYFIREDRNLVDEFQNAGYQYIDSLDQLVKLKKGNPTLGLFGETGMPWALDSKNNMRLPLIAEAAVKQLENDNGFFLLIEASQVDWAGHGNDVSSAMAEMHDMALTLEWLEQYVANRDDTLVVITADHSTGGLTLAANDEYVWDPTLLKGLKAATATMAKASVEMENPVPYIESNLGFSLTKEEKESLAEPHDNDPVTVFRRINAILDSRSNTGWTTKGHTAVDVQIFAMGKGREQFAGHLDNVEIPKMMFKMIGNK